MCVPEAPGRYNSHSKAGDKEPSAESAVQRSGGLGRGVGVHGAAGSQQRKPSPWKAACCGPGWQRTTTLHRLPEKLFCIPAVKPFEIFC